MLRKIVLGFLLLVGLASVGGCLSPGEQSAPAPAVVNVSPEATASLADPPSAPVTADPPFAATQPSVVSTDEPPVVSPSATPFDFTQDELRTGPIEPTVEIATATPCSTCPDKGQPTATDTPTPALPVAPVLGSQAPDFTLTDLNGNEVSLGDLRGQVVLVNFWATW